jgi:hypothetical protein
MKKLLLFGQTLLLSSFVFGQPEIQNAENFSEGTILVFQICNSDNVLVGKAGKKQTWDFSSLNLKEGDKITEEMISPDETNFKTNFPDANLVEKYSDGRLVFMKKTDKENYLLGFVDTESDMTMSYPKPMLFAKRPLKFSDNFRDEYETEYSVKGMDFKGKGTVSIVVDGYGTLILPNGKYENVLRVKITQTQTDKLIKYQSESTTETVSYVWFDDKHTSALLKIDETKSTYYNNKSVQYLLSETTKEK